MKRLMSSTLIAWLAANPNCLKADLFQITLPTGTVMYMTEGQFKITVPSGTSGWTGATTTFEATKYGRWQRGAITSEASYSMKSNTMSLTCTPQPATVYPSTTVGILNAALNGLFDAAAVMVYTAYMPQGQYGTLAPGGIETKFAGIITRPSDINRAKVVFECADPLYLLNMKVPTRLFQANCPYTFGDSNCDPTGTIKTANTQAFTAASGSNQNTLVPATAFSQAAGTFTQGVVTCTAGNNKGLSQSVEVHASGKLTVTMPWLMAVQVGDTFSVLAGCDRTPTTCLTKFSNQIHFGGMPFTPVPTNAI